MALNPRMLTLARDSRGMTQKELANAAGIPQSTISKYENGILKVSESDLIVLSRVLSYMPDFFLQEEKVYGMDSSFLFHRKRKEVPVAVQRRIEASVNVLRMQIDRLMRGAEIESVNRFPTLDPAEHGDDPERVAAIVRATWKIPLGPVDNVTATVEAAGGVVLRCDFGTPLIDAAHFWLTAMPPLFFLNTGMPGDRLRWTLAHEIGHAVMHPTAGENIEVEANRFASEFLMPKREIEEHLYDLTLKRAAVLKVRWKVSMAAIIRRAWDLGCISESKYRKLLTSLSAQGHKTIEPYPIPVEEPSVLWQLVEFHRRELGYSDRDLARLLYSPDPQFFAPGGAPSLWSIDGQPFFRFSKPA